MNIKKLILPLLFLSTALLYSCSQSASSSLTLQDLHGSWAIISVENEPIPDVENEGEQAPFITFDIQNGRMYGSSGCNNMMSGVDTTAAPGVLDLGNIASTRMLCQNMDVERVVLEALNRVNRYEARSSSMVVLLDGEQELILLAPIEEEEK